MTHKDFKTCLEELDGQGAKTLAEKNARYSSSDDALHNFKMGAEVMGFYGYCSRGERKEGADNE